MEWLTWTCVSVLGIVVVDRLGVWAESRGWSYWRRRSRGSTGQAGIGPLLGVFHPAHHHVVEERERRRLEVRQSGRAQPRPDEDLPEL
ncbi:hypothetical protein [Arsenicicoccus dermatophilus]|uniref:hypothetical protein n=1 Tax=Arsenicicoccus dermatophilus TaxID=1076331 RepID=UPI003916E4F3